MNNLIEAIAEFINTLTTNNGDKTDKKAKKNKPKISIDKLDEQYEKAMKELEVIKKDSDNFNDSNY